MSVVDNKSREIKKIIEITNYSDISSIKQTVTQIIETINNPASSARDLKNIIEIDPPLSAKLLKLANSALYGYPKTIGEIQEAIVCIGFDAVRELALSQKVCELFKKGDYFDGYSRSSLWKHSVAVAYCSKLIYRREFRERGENIYIAGLLHDIGIIILDQFKHKKFREILKKSRREKNNLVNVETEVLGFNHTDIGLDLGESWGFPEEIDTAIKTHHNPENVADEHARISSTIFVANCVIQSRAIGYSDAPYKNETLYQKCLMRLNVKEKAIDLIVKEVEKEISRLEQAEWF